MTWPQAGWKPVEPFPFSEASLAFRGEPREEFVAMRYFEKPGGALAAVVSFGRLASGAPGRVHGGAVLTALDEALGAAAWHAGHRVLTARLTTEFRLGVPLGATLLAETELQGKKHRLVTVRGRLVGPKGEVYAGAEGRFIELSPAALKQIFG